MSPYPTIPGFDIERVLGRGGMAVVYEATDPVLGRRVAIKVVSAQGEDAARHVRRLEQEARGLANLQHPHIVELHSFGRTEDGSLYYVMPLFEGGDLTRWPKPLPEERLKALLAQLLAALSEAHAAGIVHRDIKPANILFDRHERPLLADFGAAFVRGATRLTEHGTTIGSSHYMSPEQARGMEVDARSDLYGLGVLAYEYLVGRYPFEGEDDLSIALAKLEQPVPTLPATLSHWQAFFDRALAAKPGDRFRDAEAMRLALVAIGNPANAVVVDRPRPRWLRPALVAGVLVVIALLFAYRSSPGDVTPAMIEAAIEAGRLAPPATPNAVDLLQRVDPDDADAATLARLRSRTLAALAARTRLALDDPDAVRAWSDAVEDLDAKNDPSVRALANELSERLGQQLDDAIARHDREAAQRPIALVGAWALAPDELRARAAQAEQIKVLGDRFEDTPGAPLVLALPATRDRPALAVMTRPVDTELFARFLDASGRTGPSCPQAPLPVQACVEYDDATAFAAWLSNEAGSRYRVPSRDELAQLAKHVEPSEARAWSSTCQEQRTAQPQNVARRTWSEVRQVFGRSRLSPSVQVRCVGQFTVALDGRGDAIEARSDPAPDVAVVLVREMPRQVP